MEDAYDIFNNLMQIMAYKLDDKKYCLLEAFEDDEEFYDLDKTYKKESGEFKEPLDDLTSRDRLNVLLVQLQRSIIEYKERQKNDLKI